MEEGGGTVFVPAGVYRVEGLVIRGSKIALSGVGSASVLQSTADQIIAVRATAPLTEGTICDLAVTGSYARDNQIGIGISGLHGACSAT